MATNLFRLQVEHIPLLKRFTEIRKVDPKELITWREIPAIPISSFKDFELTSLPIEERRRFFISSGTTSSKRSKHFHNDASIAVYETSLKEGFATHFRTCNRTIPQQLLSLTPTEEQAPNSSLVHMFRTLSIRFSETHFVGDKDASGNWIVNIDAAISTLEDGIRTKSPVLITGTAFSYVHLLDQLAQRSLSFRLPEASMILETGGYKGQSREIPKNDLHKMIQSTFGVPTDAILCEYGMSELSSQAYCQGDQPFRFSPWSRAELISPETGKPVAEGETGLIRIVDLANIRSTLSIMTEDLGILCDNGFKLLGRLPQAEAKGCSLSTG
ncbi:hypothetical protein N9B94_00175 [Verrucomicrobia bacterium]|nr:hypothetical protein [Verrucomicrobiota bacterium]